MSGTEAMVMKRGRGRRGSVRMKVRLKLRKLQKLVPGGRGMRPSRLFLRTAVYILQLRSQLQVLQALDGVYKP